MRQASLPTCCDCSRTLAAADYIRDPQAAQAALSLMSTFAKEHRVDFLGLPLLPSEQQPASLDKVLLSMSCGDLQVNLHSDQHCNENDSSSTSCLASP